MSFKRPIYLLRITQWPSALREVFAQISHTISHCKLKPVTRYQSLLVKNVYGASKVYGRVVYRCIRIDLTSPMV